MKNTVFYIVLFILLKQSSTVNAQNLENLLYEMPDVIFKEIKAPEGYEKAYHLKIKQPIDHNDPSKGYFYQYATLSHRGFDQPTVIVTEGYQIFKDTIEELTDILKANQIQVEHRFFGNSSPDSIPYEFLNMKQVTADLHYINQLFKKIYHNKWISTGISKGGTTTIVYRYFYPNDVDVSVPYVAPLTNGIEDKRIYHFLDTVGTEECRNKITNFQRKILENRERVLPLLRFYSLGAHLTYNYMPIEQSFEYTVLEYSFSFWQTGGKCSEIPEVDSSMEKAVKHLLSYSSISFFSDDEYKKFGSHYYQAGTEMGYYGYNISKFKDIIKALPVNKNPSAIFMPNKMVMPFDSTLLNNVSKWLQTNGNRFIYIYGGSDTWSACAVPPSKKVDSKWFLLPGKNHYNARIKNMSEKNRNEMIDTLEKWLLLKLE